MRVYVATTNAGKLREMEQLFAGAPFALASFEGYDDPVEGDVSYADNAALKARSLHAQSSRAKKPLIRVGARGEGKWREVPWDEAFDYAAGKLSAIKEKYVLARSSSGSGEGSEIPTPEDSLGGSRDSRSTLSAAGRGFCDPVGVAEGGEAVKPRPISEMSKTERDAPASRDVQ